MLSLKERNDSRHNLLTGLGTGRDKVGYTHVGGDHAFSAEYLEQLYLHDDIAARICDLLPYEMLRQGFSVTVDEQDFLRPGLSDILRDALVKARIFGAAFICSDLHLSTPRPAFINPFWPAAWHKFARPLSRSPFHAHLLI